MMPMCGRKGYTREGSASQLNREQVKKQQFWIKYRVTQWAVDTKSEREETSHKLDGQSMI